MDYIYIYSNEAPCTRSAENTTEQRLQIQSPTRDSRNKQKIDQQTPIQGSGYLHQS